MNRAAGVARRLSWLLALSILALALYVSLGRQLVPLLAEYREEVETRAEAILQMPVRIGRLEGRWERFSPRLVAHDVRIGEGALQLERATAVVDLFESLWSRRPTLYALEFQAPRLRLAEDADGRWQLAGWPRGREGEPAPDPARILAALQRLARITLLDGQLTLQPFDEAPRVLNYLDLKLQSDGQAWRLDGQALLPDGQRLALDARARLHPQDWREMALQVYLQLPVSDWSAWLPRRLTGDWRVDRLRAGVELWVDWRDRRLERAVLRLEAPTLTAAHGDREAVQIQALGATAHLRHRPDGYQLLLDRLAFEHDGARWGPVRLSLRQQVAASAASRWQLWADRLDVGPLLPLVQALAPLPAQVSGWLAELRPRGELRNLQLRYDPGAPFAERLRYAANVAHAGINARQWVPAVDNVGGLVEGDLGGGELRLDAEAIGLHLTQLFPEPWRYRRAGGRLSWRHDEEAFTLTAPYLRLDGEEGELTGDFLIRLFSDPGREDYMDLRVGLRDGDARFAGRYLPTRLPAMPDGLAEWLQTAIRGGTVEQGYFRYQGALGADGGAEARSLGLFFQVADAELAYLPGWPALTAARGEVTMDSDGTRVRLAEGQVLGNRVRDAVARISRAQAGQPLRLEIEGEVEGSISDGLALLREAPMEMAERFAGWEGQGAVTARLDLDIPLARDERPRVVVDFSTDDATLSLPAPELQLQRIAGDFHYDSARGLSAEHVRAHALGQSISGRIEAIGTPASPMTRITALGQVPLERLQGWLGLEQALPARGELPYQLQLTLAGADSELRVDSSLTGLAIDLPAPFGKAAASRRDTRLQMTLQGSERRYWVQYADRAALAFAAPPGQWQQGRGELRLGAGAASLPLTQGLRVRGQLARVDLEAWRQALKLFGSDADGEDARRGQAAGLLSSLRLDIDRLEGLGTPVEDLNLHLRRSGRAWRLDLLSEAVAGEIRRPDAEEAPWEIHLRHLRLPRRAPVEAGARRQDPLADFDPGSLPAADLAIEQVWLGGEPLGAWSLGLRPTLGGVAFLDLDLALKGLRLTGSGAWADGRSRYAGRAEGSDLAEVLRAWGFAPSATGERFELEIDGHWPGSPAGFALERFSGFLRPTLLSGQFSEVQGSAQALRVFGLLNFDAIGRRLRLDFSDLLGRGLSYDRVTGVLEASEGVYVTREPLTMTGPSSNLELNGTLDMVDNRIDARLLVTLPLSNNLPLAAVIAGAPAIGGALWVADRLLGDRVARFATVQYRVRGPWQSPEITFDKPFEKRDQDTDR